MHAHSELSIGAFHAIARLSNGELRVWGFHEQGQLGLGPLQTQSVAEPTPLPSKLFT